jgi:hypothetical protein
MSARVSSLWAADEDGETSKALTSSKEFVRRWQALRAQPEARWMRWRMCAWRIAYACVGVYVRWQALRSQPEARVVMGLLVPEP